MKTTILTLLIFSTSVFGAIIPLEWQNATHKTVNINKNAFPMVRIKREGSTPVLLLHGLGGNAHNWMDVGSQLYKAGYDVWAITWSARFDRNIEQSGSKTVKELVNHIYAKTGKRMFIAGHSLGGIVGKIYSLGIDRNILTGKIGVNKYLKNHSQKYVLGFASINAPSGMSPSLERLMPLLRSVPNRSPIGCANLSTVINEGRLERDLYFVKAYEYGSAVSRLPFINRYTRIMFNIKYQDVSDYSIGKLIRYGTAPTSPLILAQIGSDNQSQRDNDAMVELFHSEGDHIPFVYIAGEADGIASSDIIREEAIAQNSELLFLPKAGHMDPLLGDLVTDTSLFLIKFFREYEE